MRHQRANLPASLGGSPARPSGWSATPDGGSVAWATPRREGNERSSSDLGRARRTHSQGGRPDPCSVWSATTPDGATRVVSLHDPDARPIAKGRLGKPVEFGYKAQLVDNEDGVIVDHNVEIGNPADAPMLEPADRTHRTAGRTHAQGCHRRSRLRRGGRRRRLRALGVRTVVLPRKGKPNASGAPVENRRPSRRWSDGEPAAKDGSAAPNATSVARTRIDGIDGARTWCGHGIFAHNLVKIGALTSSE